MSSNGRPHDRHDRIDFDLETIISVITMEHSDPLVTFPEMWYNVFLWSLFSSMLVHTIASIIAFTTLRKHHYGKFFPVIIIFMGTLTPLACGAMSSAAVALVYRASATKMMPAYAVMWGIGQTLIGAAVGFTRILATL
ncbi:transmembrane protein 170A [Macrosteles quadrilineatus]|uniref:transmembrane protein 170A n=1 Tax=Macrosteles quadrilineatus TaxID=74068 RepID=UPI0023E18F86|nr:transmembrane protein 170A [Macrosteles quadrilineatus]